MRPTETECEFCEDEYALCDLCGDKTCLICKLGSPLQLPFVYCKPCMSKLDSSDPSMNMPLQKLLCGFDAKDVLAEVGVDAYYGLVRVLDKFTVVGGRMMRTFADNVREIPSIKDRAAILKELHEVGGHVGVTKLYQMARSLYYWPKLIDDSA